MQGSLALGPFQPVPADAHGEEAMECGRVQISHGLDGVGADIRRCSGFPHAALEARGGAHSGVSASPAHAPPARALLTAVRDVAHDVSGDPQLLHVARSQGGLLGHPPRAHPGLLGVPVAEEAPHDGGYGPRRGGAPMHVRQPESLEQGGGGARGRWGAGWGQ